MSQEKKQHTKQGIKRLSLDDNLFEEIGDDDFTPNEKFEEMFEKSFIDKRFNKKVDKPQTNQGVNKLSINDCLLDEREKKTEPEKKRRIFITGPFS